jgi:FKBP12-rapamycin complex-associated protein
LRVLGLLGALDPYKHKMNLGQIDAQAESAVLVSITDQSEAEACQGTSKIILKWCHCFTKIFSRFEYK